MTLTITLENYDLGFLRSDTGKIILVDSLSIASSIKTPYFVGPIYEKIVSLSAINLGTSQHWDVTPVLSAQALSLTRQEAELQIGQSINLNALSLSLQNPFSGPFAGQMFLTANPITFAISNSISVNALSLTSTAKTATMVVASSHIKEVGALSLDVGFPDDAPIIQKLVPAYNTIKVFDGANWIQFRDYDSFHIKKVSNQVSEFEFTITDIQDDVKDYLKEHSLVQFFANETLLLKGRIQTIEYGSAYEVIARGLGMEAKLLDKELIKSGDKRVQYTNTSAQTIANEILSSNTDGSSPWIITPASDGIFATDFGQVSLRYEYANRLNALGKLSTSIGYDWWVSQTGAPNYNTDIFNMALSRGNTSPVAFTINTNATKSSQEKDMTQLVNYVNALGYGDGVNQISTSVYSASQISSVLSANITESSTTISLADASTFASSGEIRIMEERITYSGKSGNNLTGCTRGANGTTAREHRKAVYVEKYVAFTSPETGSSLSTYGLFDYTLIDKTIRDLSALEVIASAELIQKKTPILRVKVVPDEPSEMIRSLGVGDAITVTDEEAALFGEQYRIVGLEYRDEYGMLTLEIDASNRSLEFIELMNKLKEESQALGKYMQGATNIYVVNESENCDSSNYLDMGIYMPVEALAVNKVTLNFKLKDFRAYNSASASEESEHTHDIDVTAVPDDVYLPGLGINNFGSGNKFYSSYGSGTVSSTEEGSAHTHGITYGIYEEALSSPSVSVYVGTEGGETLVGTYTTDQTDLDITDKIGDVGSWYNIQFRPNKRMRIEANAYVQIFLESK
jgi:hypothetical protein